MLFLYVVTWEWREGMSLERSSMMILREEFVKSKAIFAVDSPAFSDFLFLFALRAILGALPSVLVLHQADKLPPVVYFLFFFQPLREQAIT